MAYSMTEAELDRSRRERIPCQACLLDEVTTDAVGYCVDCVEGLCDSCITYHRRNKASRKHDVLTIDDDGSRSRVFHCMNEIFRCQKHPDLDSKKYCMNHKQYVCSICLYTTHRSCNQVSDECDKPTDFTLVEKISGDIGKEVARFRQKIQANKGRIKDTSESVACRRKVLVAKLRRQVDELDRKLEKEAELLLHSELDNLSKDLNDCDEIEERQRNLMKIYTSLKQAGVTKKSHLLVHEMENMLRAMKENILKKQLNQIEFVETTNDLVSLGTVKLVTFSEVEHSSASADSVEEDIETDMSRGYEGETSFFFSSPFSGSIYGYGITAAKTVEINTAYVQNDDHKEREQQLVPLSKGTSTLFSSPFSGSITATKTVEINTAHVKNDDHKEREQQLVPLSKGKCTLFRKYSLKKRKYITDVTAIVSLENGWLVVADRANNVLKVLTDKFKLAYTLACDYSPLSMCMTSGQEVAVIFSDTNRIQRYGMEISDGFDNGQFFSRRKCRDITSCNENLALLVRGDQYYEIEIRRVSNGQVLKCIKGFKDISASDMQLENPSRFMYHKTKAVFLVGQDRKVHCFNEEGDELWFYKQYQEENQIETITGLAADDEDNVYVCCQGSENVHQVSAKNFRPNRVILRNMADVQAIAFDKTGKRLFVGFFGCDEISCYIFV